MCKRASSPEPSADDGQGIGEGGKRLVIPGGLPDVGRRDHLRLSEQRKDWARARRAPEDAEHADEDTLVATALSDANTPSVIAKTLEISMPPIACTARAMIRCSMLWAKLPVIEASMKTTMPPWRTACVRRCRTACR